jgi:hypothetical protein
MVRLRFLLPMALRSHLQITVENASHLDNKMILRREAMQQALRAEDR